MPSLLTTNAIITCPHGGVGTTIPSDPIFSASGGTVCCEGDMGTLSCVFPVPCVGYTLRSMALNSTYVNGRRVILSTDIQQSQTGLPLTISDPNFALDNSSPSPLSSESSGESELSSEMLDESSPVVVAVPPVAAFSTMTMMPVSMPIAFTLSHPYPLSWSLILQNGTALTSLDVTNGLPGLVVLPPGGSWDTPSTVISVTMTAVFMAALAPGSHSLYLTAASKRGIQAYAKVSITVS